MRKQANLRQQPELLPSFVSSILKSSILKLQKRILLFYTAILVRYRFNQVWLAGTIHAVLSSPIVATTLLKVSVSACQTPSVKDFERFLASKISTSSFLKATFVRSKRPNLNC